MHEVLVNRLGGLSLPRKSVVRLTDRPDMTLDVYRGRKTTQQQQLKLLSYRGSKTLKGRFLKFRRYQNFANLFSKLSETTFYKEISKFQ